jgi:multicomponent Na+:H+ antiporter subunit E
MVRWLKGVGVMLGVMLVWWALAEGVLPNWPLVVVACALVTGLVLALSAAQPIRLRWRVLPGLIGFFLWQSWLAGLDVARRALSRSARVESVWLRYPLPLSEGLARQIWIAGVGLFPGTLVVAVEADEVVIHVLDKEMAVLAGLQQFEAYLARLLPEEKA